MSEITSDSGLMLLLLLMWPSTVFAGADVSMVSVGFVNTRAFATSSTE